MLSILSWRQWAAVRTNLSLIRDPPHLNSFPPDLMVMWATQGNSLLRASPPPTTRV